MTQCIESEGVGLREGTGGRVHRPGRVSAAKAISASVRTSKEAGEQETFLHVADLVKFHDLGCRP